MKTKEQMIKIMEELNEAAEKLRPSNFQKLSKAEQRIVLAQAKRASAELRGFVREARRSME